MKKESQQNTSLNEYAKKLIEGDEQGIELIYRHSFHKLLYFGVQIAGHQHQTEVEDTIQELFVWLTANTHKLKHIENFESYLFQSLRRNLQGKLKTQAYNPHSIQDFFNYDVSPQNLKEQSPEQIQISAEEQAYKKELIHQELDKLPVYQREVLYLRFFENKSYTQIAEILSISDQVAYNYVYRAIKRLKKQLSDTVILIATILTALMNF